MSNITLLLLRASVKELTGKLPLLIQNKMKILSLRVREIVFSKVPWDFLFVFLQR